MMERGQFKRIDRRAGGFIPLVVLCLLSACAAGSGLRSAGAAPGGTRAPGAAPVIVGGVRAELSHAEVANGHAVALTVTLAAGIDPGTLRATYLGTELPFFELTPPARLALRGGQAERAAAGDEATLRQAFFGVPFSQAAGDTRVIVEAGARPAVVRLELPLRVTTGDYEIEHLKVDGKHVNPDPKVLPRIQREQKEVGAIYRTVTRERGWDGPFRLPVESALTSRYGNKRYYNGEMRNFHSGADLRAAVGTPIHAAQGGTVVLAKDLYFSGKTVIIDHGYGVQTMYAHLSALGVRKGRRVKTGERIGLAGATGRVSGPHLHWTWILHQTKVDPMQAIQVLK
jgi:murein DD-endopeptidase MepM/ murein hydrolase activator NlpD